MGCPLSRRRGPPDGLEDGALPGRTVSVTWEVPVYRGSLGTRLLGTAAAALTRRRASRPGAWGGPHFLLEAPGPAAGAGLQERGWTVATAMGSSAGALPPHQLLAGSTPSRNLEKVGNEWGPRKQETGSSGREGGWNPSRDSALGSPKPFAVETAIVPEAAAAPSPAAAPAAGCPLSPLFPLFFPWGVKGGGRGLEELVLGRAAGLWGEAWSRGQ